MKTIERHHHHTLMDRALPPAIRIVPGEPLVIETLDACYGRVRSLADFTQFRDGPDYRPDPLTGPVYIEGAHALVGG